VSVSDGQGSGNRTYPVHLRLEGRNVLLVGAGRGAMRRLDRLLETGARIVVVGPDVADEIEQLAAAGLIELRRRPFEPADLHGMWMVHTATDDAAVNEAVLAAARAAAGNGGGPALVSSAEADWAAGDFVLPAAFDHGIATVSVGTGGTDYRRARDIKTVLKRQLEAVADAELVVIGADQRSLDVAALEHVCREAGEERRLRATLASLRPVDEFFVLNTCNRFECYMIAGANPIVRELAVHGMRLHTIPPDQRYIHRGRDAFVHLSLVLAGAYANLFGETAIVQQVKESLERARSAETAGPRLERYVTEALNISRRVRLAVMAGLESREAEDLCAARLNNCRPTLGNETALVIGTGAVGRAVMGRIAGRPKKTYWAFFRNAPNLEGLPADNIEVIGVNRVPEVLGSCDVIVVASGAKEPIIRPEHASLFAGRRPLIMDLSVPRGVDPELAKHGEIDLVHLQELVNGARPSDVPGLVRLSEESARLESYRFMKEDAVCP
jgi:glutamyl-tRNA reductase